MSSIRPSRAEKPGDGIRIANAYLDVIPLMESCMRIDAWTLDEGAPHGIEAPLPELDEPCMQIFDDRTI